MDSFAFEDFGSFDVERVAVASTPPVMADGTKSVPPIPALVSFYPWEYEHGHEVGMRRTIANFGKQDRASYQNNRKQAERDAGPAAALCELAVAKHLCLYWSGSAWAGGQHRKYRDLPDVDPCIEVRRLRSKNNKVAVRTKDLNSGLILVAAFLVNDEFSEVEVLGWLTADEAWEVGEEAFYDKTGETRIVPWTQMRDISTLTRDVIFANLNDHYSSYDSTIGEVESSPAGSADAA
jgi:hypothetical protein